MTEFELNNEYFEWMCQLVCNERYSRRLSYQKLLRHLHNIDFNICCQWTEIELKMG